MNQFVVDYDPIIAAQSLCDKHVVKQTVEQFQMLGSALRRHGATDEQMPLTSKGTPLVGGYRNHPITKWVGETQSNFNWAIQHGLGLAKEYTHRYGKTHACEAGIFLMSHMVYLIPNGELTDFGQAMPDEYKDEDPVVAYRRYYIEDKIQNIDCRWTNREKPEWLR